MIKKVKLQINIDMEKIKDELPLNLYEELQNKSEEEWNSTIEKVVKNAVESKTDEFITLKEIEVISD